MANLQYIGARYVPKFYENSLDPSSMDWESGHGYEPLTVVTYNSDTYTSKIPVPSTVSDPASNPTYWAKTADFNAALVALQNAVNSLNINVNDLLTSREFNIQNKRFVLIGDSLGTGTYSGNTDGGWCNYFKTILGLYEGDNAFTTAINGIGWTTTPTSFLTMAQALTTTDDDTITDVIVLGGLNDYTSNFNTIYAAANTLVTYLKNRFKNATIRFGVIGRSRDNSAINTSLDRNVIPAIRNCNAVYIDNAHNFAHQYRRFTDTWHWNDAYTLVFSHLLAANYGAKIEIAQPHYQTIFTPDSEFASSNNPVPYMTQDNAQICIEAHTGILFQYTTTKAFTDNEYINIPLGTIDSLIAGDNSKLIPVTGYIGFTAPTSEFQPFTGYLKFEAASGGVSNLTLQIVNLFAGDTTYVHRTVRNFYFDVPACEVASMFA